MIVCPSCGTQNPETAKFCAECGTRLQPVEPFAPPPPPAEMTTVPAPEPEFAAAEDIAPIDTPLSTEPEEPPPPKKDTSGLPPAWMPPPVTLQSRPSGQVYPPAAQPAPAQPSEPAPSAGSGSMQQPEKDVSGLPPAWMPPPVTPTFQGGSGGDDGDWKMSDLGPVPERRNRRLWLWIPLGMMAFVLVCCIAVFIWSATIGEDTIDRWATEASIERTEEALSGD